MLPFHTFTILTKQVCHIRDGCWLTELCANLLTTAGVPLGIFIMYAVVLTIRDLRKLDSFWLVPRPCLPITTEHSDMHYSRL